MVDTIHAGTDLPADDRAGAALPRPPDISHPPLRLLATPAAHAGIGAVGQAAEVTILDLATPPGPSATRADLALNLAALAMPEELAQMRGWLDAAGLDRLPVVAWTGSPLTLLPVLAGLMHETRADAGRARHAAGLLRIELDRVQARFRALESFAYSIGGPTRSLALDWPAEGMTLRGDAGPGHQGGQAAQGAIRQNLPLDASSIAAVELWFPNADATDAARLTVGLHDREDVLSPLVLDPLSVAAGGGWLRFTGGPMVGRDAQDCTLVIHGPLEDVDIGLSMPVPDPAFHAQGLAEETDRVLALRVWRAVSQLALPALPGPAADAARTSRILPSELPRPALLAVPGDASDHVVTSFWAREDAILVHPSARGPVCALLQRIPLPVPQHVSAIIHVAHAAAPVIGFAIGCLPPGHLSQDDWQRHLGPWTYLAPGSWGEVHAFAAPAAGSSCDLILATCVAGAARNDNAWALFRGFRMVWGAS